MSNSMQEHFFRDDDGDMAAAYSSTWCVLEAQLSN